MTSYLEWPGKSRDPKTGIRHPAVYHMLDVAAVANTLLKSADFARPLHNALLLLAALHDLGKIGDRFRGMIEEGGAQGDPVPRTRGDEPRPSLSAGTISCRSPHAWGSSAS